MASSLPPHYLQLVQDAALKSFWRRDALNDFLRRCGVAGTFLATWSKDETKRDLLKRLFPRLEASEKGPLVITHMAHALAEQQTFPDLEGWEDSEQKKTHAREAVAALAKYLRKQREDTETESEKIATRKRAAAIQEQARRQRQDLSSLDDRLTKLAPLIGTQQGGYDFQDWFYDLADYFEVPARRPYNVDGRQIDGSITVEGTTYLVETKFSAAQTDVGEIDSFLVKVTDKADNTMGLMLAMCSYTKVAIRQASKPRTPVLLLDHNHVYLMLHSGWKLPEVVCRLRRHASQTAEAYLQPAMFSM